MAQGGFVGEYKAPQGSSGIIGFGIKLWGLLQQGQQLLQALRTAFPQAADGVVALTVGTETDKLRCLDGIAQLCRQFKENLRQFVTDQEQAEVMALFESLDAIEALTNQMRQDLEDHSKSAEVKIEKTAVQTSNVLSVIKALSVLAPLQAAQVPGSALFSAYASGVQAAGDALSPAASSFSLMKMLISIKEMAAPAVLAYQSVSPEAVEKIQQGGRVLAGIIYRHADQELSQIGLQLPKGDPWPVESLPQRQLAYEAIQGGLQSYEFRNFFYPAIYNAFVDNYDQTFGLIVGKAVGKGGKIAAESMTKLFSPTYGAVTTLLSQSGIQSQFGEKGKALFQVLPMLISTAVYGDLTPIIINLITKVGVLGADVSLKQTILYTVRESLQDVEIRAMIEQQFLAGIGNCLFNDSNEKESSKSEPVISPWYQAAVNVGTAFAQIVVKVAAPNLIPKPPEYKSLGAAETAIGALDKGKNLVKIVRETMKSSGFGLTTTPPSLPQLENKVPEQQALTEQPAPQNVSEEKIEQKPAEVDPELNLDDVGAEPQALQDQSFSPAIIANIHKQFTAADKHLDPVDSYTPPLKESLAEIKTLLLASNKQLFKDDFANLIAVDCMLLVYDPTPERLFNNNQFGFHYLMTSQELPKDSPLRLALEKLLRLAQRKYEAQQPADPGQQADHQFVAGGDDVGNVVSEDENESEGELQPPPEEGSYEDDDSRGNQAEKIKQAWRAPFEMVLRHISEPVFKNTLGTITFNDDDRKLKRSFDAVYHLIGEKVESNQIRKNDAFEFGQTLSYLIMDLNEEEQYRDLTRAMDYRLGNKHTDLTDAITVFTQCARQVSSAAVQSDQLPQKFDAVSSQPHLGGYNVDSDEVKEVDQDEKQDNQAIPLGGDNEDQNQAVNLSVEGLLLQARLTIQASSSISILDKMNETRLAFDRIFVEINDQLIRENTCSLSEDEAKKIAVDIGLLVQSFDLSGEEGMSLLVELFNLSIETLKNEGFRQKLIEFLRAALNLAALIKFEQAKAEYKDAYKPFIQPSQGQAPDSAHLALQTKLETVQTTAFADLKMKINTPEETYLIAQETRKLIGKLTAKIPFSPRETFETAAEAYYRSIKPCIKTARLKRAVVAFVGAVLGLAAGAVAGLFAAGPEGAYIGGAAGAVIGGAIGYKIAHWHSKRNHPATQFAREAARFKNYKK